MSASVVILSPDDLRSLVREVVLEAVREAITALEQRDATRSHVDRNELARSIGVSPTTVTRLTSEGMPHVFVGASPRYVLDEVKAWLSERGRKGTTASTRGHAAAVAGVRLLSRQGKL